MSDKKLDAPPLTDKRQPWGVIRFIHFRDGTEHKFYTAVNRLSGNRLCAFDTDPPAVGESMAYIKSVFRDIRKKAQVLEYAGTKHFQ